MTIIQYDLVPIDNHRKVIPLWVKDGGYFQDRETEQLIGIADEQYLPAYIRVLTEEELLAYVLEQHAKKQYEKNDYENHTTKIMTTDDIAVMIDYWLGSKRGE